MLMPPIVFADVLSSVAPALKPVVLSAHGAGVGKTSRARVL